MAMNGEPLTKYIESFFRHLTDDLGLSPHTIRSYSNAIGSLLDFFKEEKNMLANRIELSALNRNTVIEYLNWLQRKRGNSDRTRNHRLAAISSFAKVMMYEDIAHINQWSEILTIKQKKTDTPHFNYLSVEGMRHLLVAIPTDTRRPSGFDHAVDVIRDCCPCSGTGELDSPRPGLSKGLQSTLVR